MMVRFSRMVSLKEQSRFIFVLGKGAGMNDGGRGWIGANNNGVARLSV